VSSSRVGVSRRVDWRSFGPLLFEVVTNHANLYD
jgi:hypothetical protein